MTDLLEKLQSLALGSRFRACKILDMNTVNELVRHRKDLEQ